MTLLLMTACNPGPTGAALPARRLSPTEYNNTVRDLYGFDEEWPEPCEHAVLASGPLCSDTALEQAWPYVLPPDVLVHGFEGMAEGQHPSGSHVEAYERAARHFAPFVHLSPAFSLCGQWSDLPDDEATACVSASVERFAQRAWRRPASEEELSRLRSFHSDNVARFGLQDGTTLTVQGLLQSPQFLYLLPPGDAEAPVTGDPLNDWQMAARLSYFLWDSMPDEALFEAASKGRLNTPRQVRRQAERMVEDPKARQMVVHFHRQWLELDSVYTALPDMDTYGAAYLPGLAQLDEGVQEQEEYWSGALIGLRRGMVLEAEKFVEHSIFDGTGTLQELYTSPYGFVTDVSLEHGEPPLLSTADIYGISERTSRRYDVEMDDGNLGYFLNVQAAKFPEGQRAGLLTLGAVLTAQAHPVHPAPVLRGKLVLERMVCTDLGPPPDSAAGQAPADTLDAEATNRERVAAVTEVSGCIGCHQTLNPPGFALENYDAMGGWREQDNGHPVDASGSFTVDGETFAFSNAVELSAALGSSRVAHDCYVQHWVQYALGRSDSAADAQAIQALQSSFYAEGGQIKALLVEIAASELMRSHGIEGGA